MTTILDRAIEKAKALPSDRQDEVGEMILAIVEHDESNVRLSAAQEEEVRRRLANPPPLVPEHEMEAFFRKLTG